jgi:hypothetical protein
VNDSTGLEVLRLIQATRHQPPGFAANDATRHRRYGSSLQQFDELIAASRNCGPASRPLPLFYALSQAGLAICAAYKQTAGGQTKASHGLTVPTLGQSLRDIDVAPKGQGGFQAVANTTGSAQITAEVSVGALWASLPEGASQGRATNAYPGALVLIPEDKRGPSPFLKLTDKAVAWVFGFPDSLGNAEKRLEFIKRHLNQYPTAKGWDSPSANDVAVMQDPAAGCGARLQWRLPRASGSAEDRIEYLLTTVAPRYERFSMGWIRPIVGPNRDSPSPLMTWWAILFALSTLARYHPDQWVEMLNLDHSPDAATLMEILDDALAWVPRLVLEALRRTPYLTA